MDQLPLEVDRPPDFPAMCGQLAHTRRSLDCQSHEADTPPLPREAKIQLRSNGRHYPVRVQCYRLDKRTLGFDVWAQSDIARRRLLVDCEHGDRARLILGGVEYTVSLGTYAPLSSPSSQHGIAADRRRP